MLTIAEASPMESTAVDVARPREWRQRTASESLGRVALPLPDRKTVQRSASCSELYAQRRERQRHELQADVARYRIRLACRDEALCVRSKENLLLLVETVQQKDDASSTSVLLAKKALKYRRLLVHAQQVDLSDPTVDVSEFLREKRSGRAPVVELCVAP